MALFDDDECSPKGVALGGCCCCVLILSAILVACSFGILTPHEIGLDYNGVSKYLDPETVWSGRHFIGLAHSFVVYPRKLQYVEFSSSSDGGSRNQPINVWSRDGQEIILEAGFYYKIIPEKLSQLYYKYNQDYLPIVEDIATDAFRDVATKYDTVTFFTNRSQINDEMNSTLYKRLAKSVFCTVERFNLLSIDTPRRFENAVIAKVVKQQEERTLQLEQDSAVLQEEVNVIAAQAARDIVVLRAETQHNATIMVNKAKAAAFETVQRATAQLRKQLADHLGLSGPANSTYTSLMNYMWLDVVRGSAANSKLVFNSRNALLELNK